MKEESQSCDGPVEDLQDLPPSAKLVFKVLQYEGSLSQKKIADETLLSPRTVRYALTKLEKKEIVTSQISFMDARKNIYSLEAAFQHNDSDQSP